MKAALLILAMSIPALASAQAPVAAKPKLPPAPQARCLTLSEIDRTMDPIHLTRAMLACIQEGRDSDAVDLYNVAGIFAKFDTLRVSDKSAHAAYPMLKVKAGQALGEEKSAEFNQTLKRVSSAPGYNKRLCDFTAGLYAPSYAPSYMVNHGMGAFTGAKQTVDNFEPTAAWAKVRAEYVKCASVNGAPSSKAPAD